MEPHQVMCQLTGLPLARCAWSPIRSRVKSRGYHWYGVHGAHQVVCQVMELPLARCAWSPIRSCVKSLGYHWHSVHGAPSGRVSSHGATIGTVCMEPHQVMCQVTGLPLARCAWSPIRSCVKLFGSRGHRYRILAVTLINYV